jgi:prevent-host-death family protein
MRTVGLFEAKQKLSELVQRARDGEKIGITRRGELTAVLIPVAPKTSLRDVFQDIERIRKRAKLSRSLDVKKLIEEGRTWMVLSLMLPLHFAGFWATLMPPFANRVKQHLLKGAKAVVPALWHLEMSNGLVVAQRRSILIAADVD